MRILGIETSCDETAAAVVEDGQKLLSNVVASSLDLHIPFGGVVPEIAARSHIESILPVIDKALQDAFEENSRQKTEDSIGLPSTVYGLPSTSSSDLWSQIDAIAVTQGPGLLGSLLIGVLTARTLAIAKNKPLIPVNHVLSHVYATFLTSFGDGQKANTSFLSTNYDLLSTAPEFPILALIVSGGHTSLVLFKDHGKYKVLGQTRDDAAGEAFDKVAKMLGLPYPGGPALEKLAKKGDPKAFNFPKAQMSGYDFSFSGLKTAVLRSTQKLIGKTYDFPSHKLSERLSVSQKADIAASFQRTAVETLVEALEKAASQFKPKSIVVAGGVAANQELRRTISERLKPQVHYPPIELCTDNAAMIAAAAFHNQRAYAPYSLAPEPGLMISL